MADEKPKVFAVRAKHGSTEETRVVEKWSWTPDDAVDHMAAEWARSEPQWETFTIYECREVASFAPSLRMVRTR